MTSLHIYIYINIRKEPLLSEIQSQRQGKQPVQVLKDGLLVSHRPLCSSEVSYLSFSFSVFPHFISPPGMGWIQGLVLAKQPATVPPSYMPSLVSCPISFTLYSAAPGSLLQFAYYSSHSSHLPGCQHCPPFRNFLLALRLGQDALTHVSSARSHLTVLGTFL